jgi:hypothetical protein
VRALARKVYPRPGARTPSNGRAASTGWSVWPSQSPRTTGGSRLLLPGGTVAQHRLPGRRPRTRLAASGAALLTSQRVSST